MSINVYLDPSIVRDDAFRLHYDGKIYQELLDRHRIHTQEDKRVYFMVRLTQDVPDAILPYVVSIECVERFFSTWREPGVYRRGKSLLRLNQLGDGQYEAHLEGKSLQSVCKLYELMREGKIRPVRSWNARQVRPSTETSAE